LAILSNALDVDQDGLPDSFEQQIIAASTATNGLLRTIWDVRPSDDFDGDGLSNLAEYFAGTSPVDPASRFVLYLAEPPAGGMVTLRWPSVPGRVYSVYQSTNLITGFTTLQTNIAATSGTNVFVTPVTGSATFYMIGVQ
jgi:hypothetical protein